MMTSKVLSLNFLISLGVTFCKFSPKTSKIDLPYSMNSFRETIIAVFGAGNFKSLFEAIEREQDKRGNL